MSIKDTFVSYYNDLDDKISLISKYKKEQASLVVASFYENTLLQLEDILDRKENKVIKDMLKNNIIVLLTDDLKLIDKNTSDIVTLIKKNIKDIVVSNCKNHTFNLNVSDIVIKETKNRLNNLNSFNKDFIKKFDPQFDLFLYNISVCYKLKNDVSVYNLINRNINQNKKILFDNLKDLEEKYKEDILSNISLCFNNFTREVKDIKESYNYKNNKILLEYQEDLLKNSVSLRIEDTLKSNVKEIEKILLKCHYQVLKEQKSRDIKEKEMELNSLYNCLVSFNNTLFDKSLNTLTKMVSVVCLDNDDLEKIIKKYNDIIFKICDFEYNFDKQFLLYRQKMLNRKYFLSSKATDNIINEIDGAKSAIISVIKVSIVNLFKTTIDEVNRVNYKRLTVSYKLENFYDVLDEKLVSKLI